ncbi:unnamed protein product [Ectocarpus sp. 12 AP-2014]
MSVDKDMRAEEHEISNPVEECKKWQKKYYRCVKKFGRGYMRGEARSEERDDCLERFDDFQKCVLDAARKMQEQRSARKGWW